MLEHNTIESIIEGIKATAQNIDTRMNIAYPESNTITMSQLEKIFDERDAAAEKIPTFELVGLEWIKYRYTKYILRNFITIIDNERILKHLKYNFHLGVKAYIEAGVTSYLEEALSTLTCGGINKLSDYEIEITSRTEPTHYGKCIYRILKFKKGKYPLIIVDQIEKEQPGMTDTQPTENPYFLHVGLMVNEKNVCRIY